MDDHFSLILVHLTHNDITTAGTKVMFLIQFMHRISLKRPNQIPGNLVPESHPFFQGLAINWMMKQIFTWEMVGNDHVHPL